MAIITVYSFRYHDPEQDVYMLGSGKCSRDEILSKGWVVIESTSEEIDSSVLTSTGRYYPPQPNPEA